MGRSARTQDPSALSCGPSDSLRVPLRMPAAAVSYALLFHRNRALSAYRAATLIAGMTAMHTQMATAVLFHALRHRSGSATTKAAAIDKTPRTPRRDRPQGAIPTDSRTPMTKTVAQNAEDAPASLHPASSSRRVNMANVLPERRAGQDPRVRSGDWLDGTTSRRTARCNFLVKLTHQALVRTHAEDLQILFLECTAKHWVDLPSDALVHAGHEAMTMRDFLPTRDECLAKPLERCFQPIVIATALGDLPVGSFENG